MLVATIVGFVWGRFRHDVVALASLLACSVFGLIDSGQVFSGFGHPAVITVACVLVLSAGLQGTGVVKAVAETLLPSRAGPAITIPILIILATVMSAFVNNVGALALLMPVALQLAERDGIPPGRVLMPLAFGSILGGMTTMIGTPPNLIVSGFREDMTGEPFAMFDFTPVGLAVAVAGLVLIAAVARWLVPVRTRAGVGGFKTGAYVTEARVTSSSRAVGMTLGELEVVLRDVEALVIGIVRQERHISAPSKYREIHAGDVLQIQADHDSLRRVIAELRLALEESLDPSPEKDDPGARVEQATSRGAHLTELVVMPGSVLAGRSVKDLRIRSRFGINLLALSRHGEDAMTRLRAERLRTGDVLLLQGTDDAVAAFAARYACAPLQSRSLRMPGRRLAIPAALIMVFSIAAAAFGLLPPAISFALGVLLFLVLGVMPVRELYHSVDWPVIVLLGALIPVAGAMSTTGTAELLARWLLESGAQGNPILALALILIVTMTLSDFMNNAATSAVMCPIAIGTAQTLGASADPFLMAVAVGASCAFLTPIGHQNNTLILGAGGFRFGDYWRLGLPIEIIVVAVAVPMIVVFWPLGLG